MLLHLSPEAPVPPLTGGRERGRRVLAYLAARRPVHALTCASAEEAPHLPALLPDLQLAGLTAEPYPPRRPGYRALLPAARRLLAAAGTSARRAFETVHCQGLDLWPVARALPVPRRVLELHDLPGPLAAPPRRSPGPRAGALLRRLREAHTLIVVSERDADVLRQWGAFTHITVVPNGVDLAYWTLPPAAADPHTLLFPAALNWPPNAAAARRLIAEILPRVRQQFPGARLVVAGRLPPQSLVALAARHPAVTLVVDPPDMRPLVSQAAIVLVPAVAATGTRLKILQALAAGRPVVSTPAGAAGLDLVPGRDLCVAGLVEPFVSEIVRLLRDETARASLAHAGLAAVQRFDWPRVLPALDAIYSL